MNYNNYQTQQDNVPIFDSRNVYVQGNPHGESQSFGSENNRGGGDGNSVAEFMKGDPDGSELDGDRVETVAVDVDNFCTMNVCTIVNVAFAFFLMKKKKKVKLRFRQKSDVNIYCTNVALGFTV